MTSPARRRAPSIAEMRMEYVARIAAGGALFVVVAGFAWSFAQIKWVADQMGAQPPQLSYAFPFIVDMPALVATALTVALHDRPFRQRAYAWSILVIFTAISWLCNAVHAIGHASIYTDHPNGWTALLSILIAGLAPLAVVVGMHVWAFALRHSASAEQAAARAPTRPATTSAPRAMPRAETPAPARADAPPSARADKHAAMARARDLFDTQVSANPTVKPDARVLQRDAGMDELMHPGNFRKVVRGWWDEHEAALEAATAPDPVAAELAAVAPPRAEIDAADVIPAVEEPAAETG